MNKCVLIENKLLSININMNRNDPDINRKYNYVYKITNTVNGMEYIGVHRTDNIDDGYMGSGKLVKRSIAKHGKESFTKEILEYFPTYREALIKEKGIVTLEYANRDDTYNLREGGYGKCEWSDKWRKEFSEYKKAQWADTAWREDMIKKIYTNERAEKISRSLKGKSRENPQNKDLEKIRKTAEAHRGMKRSEQAKRNMSNAAKNVSKEVKLKRSGRGMVYIHNQATGEVKRVEKGTTIEGWLTGSGSKKSNKYKGMNKDTYFGYNEDTLKIKRFQKGDELPTGWQKGRPSKK